MERVPEEEETVRYRCRSCSRHEEIPLDVVLEFHLLDPGDPTVPPRFSCERCGGEMWPEEEWDMLHRRIDPYDFEGGWEKEAEEFYRTEVNPQDIEDLPFR